jgi:hypothetical protein
MPIAVRKRSVRLLILPACAAALAACSSGPSSSSSSTTRTTSATTTTSAATTTTAASTTSSTAARTASGTSQTSGTLVPQTSTSTEFVSPSKNISCEIDSNFGQNAITSTLCLTVSPPKSVTLGTDGTLTECTGVSCLSNAGLNTPTLAYGMSITLSPFTCSSSTAGVKCTLANGDGFLISSAAVAVLGSAKVGPPTTTTTVAG